jgi:hypothetical protein
MGPPPKKKRKAGHTHPKPTHCGSCGREGHARSTSKQCPNNKPRQGSTWPPNTRAADYFQVEDVRAVKLGLAGLCRSEELNSKIQALVGSYTRNAFWATRLMNLEIQEAVERGGALPDVTSLAWIRQFFTFNFHDLQHPTHGTPHPDAVPGQVAAQFCADYAVNVGVHLDVTFASMYRRFLHFKLRHLANKKQRNRVIAACLGDEDERPDFPFLLRGDESQSEKLILMYRWNLIFTKAGTTLFNLLPQHTAKAKYVKIDTDVLHSLVPRAGVSQKEFGQMREDRWREHFRLGEKFFRPWRRFACEMRTDGKAVSLIMRSWRLVERDKEARAAARSEDISVGPGTRMVGVDPGRKDLATAVDDEENVFTLSNKRYYRDCKFTERKRWAEARLREKGLWWFLCKMPTSKTHCASATLAHIDHLLINKGATNAVFAHELEGATRHHRWKTQIHKPKTLDKFCLEILGGQKERTVVSYGDASFCHTSKGHAPSLKGNWIFHRLRTVHKARVRYTRESNTSQVCTLCYFPQKLVGIGTQRDPHGRRGLAETPTERRSLLTVGSKHFVRKCTSCHTIWYDFRDSVRKKALLNLKNRNRDVNAARAIRDLGRIELSGGERPEIYRTPLPKPPLLS